MLWVLFFLGCLCAVSFAAALLFRRRFEQTVGLVWLAAGAITYLLALVGILRAASYLIPAAGAVSIVFLGYHFLKTKRFTLRSLTPGFWTFLLLAMLCWWQVRGRNFIDWDEFSHWGLAIKDMYYSDRLYTSAEAIFFPDYPPIMPLLEYLLVRLAPSFREDLALYAMDLFTISLLVYPLGSLRCKKAWRQALVVPVSGVLLWLQPVVFFPRYYTSITVDGIMGILLGYAVLVCVLEECRSFAAWQGALALMTLALCKGAGFPLAMMGAVVVALLVWCDASGLILGQKCAKKYGKIGSILVVVLLPLAANSLWSMHCNRLEIGSKWTDGSTGSSFSWGALVDLITKGEPEYRLQVLENYWLELLTAKSFGLLKLPYMGLWLVLSIGVVAFVLCTVRYRKKQLGIGLVGLAVETVIFAVALLYSYLFVFDPVEAVMLASVTRYLGTPITGFWWVLVASLLVELVHEESHKRIWAKVGVLVALLVITAAPGTVDYVKRFVNASTEAAQTQHDRYLYRQAVDTIYMCSDGSDVYIIAPQDNGLAVNYISYELAPVALPEQNSGIGCLYPTEWYTGYTVYCSPEQWSRILYDGPFRYVYLFQVDGYFATGYHILFEDEAYLVNGSLLEVVRHEDGVVTLRGVILGENK